MIFSDSRFLLFLHLRNSYGKRNVCECVTSITMYTADSSVTPPEVPIELDRLDRRRERYCEPVRTSIMRHLSLSCKIFPV